MGKKNILMVSFDFPPSWGGVATYSYEVAHGLAQKGHKVTILTGLGQFKVESNILVIRKPLPQQGILAVPQMLLALRHLLKTKSFDHIFCSLWMPDGASVWLVKKLLNISTPYSISVHAMEILESNGTLKKKMRAHLKPLKNKVFANANHILAVSQFSKELLLKNVDVPPENIQVINNGANANIYKPPHKSSQANYPRLFTACRLISNKGVDNLLRALPRVRVEHPHIKLNIAGDGPDRQRLEHLCESLNLRNSVTFLGKISQAKIIEEFQQAHLFAMLSRQEGHFVEGFGLVFLEAALCGTASLGGRSGGIPDAIEENVTGWLVDPLNITAIEEKLLDILKNQQALSEMSERALKKTKASKTWAHRIDEIQTTLGL